MMLVKRILAWMSVWFAAIGLSACGGNDSTAAENGGGASSVKEVSPYSALPKGTFALQFSNNTRGVWADNQIYIEVIGLDGPALPNLPAPRMTYAALSQDEVVSAPQQDGSLGVIKSASAADNSAANCLQANGTCYPAYAITLAELKNHTLYLPGNGKYYGSRIYISLGAPLYMKINADATGYVQPDLANKADPNYGTVFDWYEFTYDPDVRPVVAFGGNVTQVDLFSFPLSFEVQGVNGTDMKRGISMGSTGSAGVKTRDELIGEFMRLSDAGFYAPQTANGGVVRLMSPLHTPFATPASTYFDAYIGEVWKHLQVPGTTVRDQLTAAANQYVSCGTGPGDSLCMDGVNVVGEHEHFYMKRPSTADMVKSAGALQPGGIQANAFGALLAGALNRHVADRPWQDWLTPTTYYGEAPKNDWAQFWHRVSIDGLAYGMPFDDTANQSSVAILRPDEDLKSLSIGIGW